jgi:hypothetical protein
VSTTPSPRVGGRGGYSPTLHDNFTTRALQLQSPLNALLYLIALKGPLSYSDRKNFGENPPSRSIHKTSHELNEKNFICESLLKGNIITLKLNYPNFSCVDLGAILQSFLW